MPLTHYPLILSSLLLAALGFCSPEAGALEWPQTITGDKATLVIYQPQPEALEGNLLTARTALSIEQAGSDVVFGAMWFEANIDTDQDAGTALVRNIKVTRVTWPDSQDTGEQRLAQLVEAAFPEHGLEIGWDQLSASLESADIERRSLENLNTAPPKIVFAESLAVLLMYDGEPRFKEIDDSAYERALNTPFLVVKQQRANRFYLSSGDRWYEAQSAQGPWALTDSPPEDLRRQVEAALKEQEATPSNNGEAAPTIVVATEPTELIVTDGKPEWQALEGGELLYVSNTETPWVRHLPTGNMYLLLSGRWFRASKADGPWEFVRGDKLPDAFSAIPPASDIGGLRVSVAGTEEADQAMLDAAVPQTAAIKRDEASLEVSYDGEPKFSAIAGTKVSYAVNTGAQVLEIEGTYYAVDDGVWFIARTAKGPWTVADSIPANEINKIPADSPVYNLTHVHVYESTKEVVYVGYTPGYLWSYPYYGVPVYGTGWYYPPYWGSYYYPRPPTWGLHVGYNPWTGWNFGLSWSNGFFTAGISWGGGYGGAYRPWGCCGGWYGGGYRGPTFINTGDINIGNNINIGNRENIANRLGKGGLTDGSRVGGRFDKRNLYSRPENRNRLANAAQTRDLKRARPASNRANNVFADRNGQIARRAGTGWETRENGQWKRSDSLNRASASRPAASRNNLSRPSTARPAQRPQIDRSGLNRAHRARNTGRSRQNMRRPSGTRLRR